MHLCSLARLHYLGALYWALRVNVMVVTCTCSTTPSIRYRYSYWPVVLDVPTVKVSLWLKAFSSSRRAFRPSALSGRYATRGKPWQRYGLMKLEQLISKYIHGFHYRVMLRIVWFLGEIINLRFVSGWVGIGCSAILPSFTAASVNLLSSKVYFGTEHPESKSVESEHWIKSIHL